MMAWLKGKIVAVIPLVLVAVASSGLFWSRWVAAASSPALPTGSIQSLWSSFHWTEVFHDQFDGTSLDASHWVTCYWWDAHGCTNQANNELEWYQPGNVVVKDGYLLLVAKPGAVTAPNARTYPYTSGMVTTGSDTMGGVPRFAFTYGFVEVRAWIPSGQGLWPAIWLLPANQSSSPEIDLMEIIGSQPGIVHMNLHYRNPDGSAGLDAGQWAAGSDLSSGWHTFALDWEPDAITWYVDGVARRKFTDAARIPSTPMYLLINLAVGGDWPGNPSAQTIFPSIFTIDYVQIWQSTHRVHLLP